MEEYIRLEEEKARRHGKVYSWEIAMYGRIGYDDDVHDLRSVKIELPDIVFNDTLTPEIALSWKPLIFIIKNLCVPFGIPFDPKQFYKDGVKTRELQRPRVSSIRHIEPKPPNTVYWIPYGYGVPILDLYVIWLFYLEIKGISTLGEMAEGLSGKRRIENMDAQGQKEIESAGFDAYWVESVRQIPDKGLIACSIVGRSQAPKKVTVTDLFYLRGMDLDSVNILIFWLALGLERQPDAAVGAPKVVEGAPDVDEGAQAISAPVQAP
nr:hypothetical protein [Tanacetum cinerariifolium]